MASVRVKENRESRTSFCVALPPLLRLRSEGQAQPRGEQHIVVLFPRHRLAVVTVGEIQVPGQYLVELARQAKVEDPAIISVFVQVGEEVEVLNHRRVGRKLVGDSGLLLLPLPERKRKLS